MDLSFVDTFTLVLYLLKYVTKSEREIGLMLTNRQNEHPNRNMSAKEALAKNMAVFISTTRTFVPRGGVPANGHSPERVVAQCCVCHSAS